jgi:hypothetical protein
MSKGRVLVLNNYSLDRVWAEVRRGDKPAHHLYGVDLLQEAGYEVHILPLHEKSAPEFLSKAMQRFGSVLGNVRQQWEAWKVRRGFDMIYAPCQDQTQSLGYLRALRLFELPILVVAHHPLIRGRFSLVRRLLARWQLRGTDAFPALSHGVAAEINHVCGKASQSQPLHWGPDLDFYAGFPPSTGSGAYAAGRTGRDFGTLYEAALKSGAKAQITCLTDDPVMALASSKPTDHVTILHARTEADLGYRQLLPQMAAARVHAIPLSNDPSLAGLTSLTDALALGKPVIMTRHRLIDLDLEAEGIGKWVSVGDVQGWADALTWFENHPEEALVMGRRARKIVETRWNHRVFAREIEAHCRQLIPSSWGSMKSVG